MAKVIVTGVVARTRREWTVAVDVPEHVQVRRDDLPDYCGEPQYETQVRDEHSRRQYALDEALKVHYGVVGKRQPLVVDRDDSGFVIGRPGATGGRDIIERLVSLTVEPAVE